VHAPGYGGSSSEEERKAKRRRMGMKCPAKRKLMQRRSPCKGQQNAGLMVVDPWPD
jgi:hypothetical protein